MSSYEKKLPIDNIQELKQIAETTDNHQMKRSIQEKLKRMSHDDKLICK